MCEVVTDLVHDRTYKTARQMQDAGILVTMDDILDADKLGPDGLLHGYHQMIDGVKVPCEPFSPLDSCLCGIDTAAALDRTPGLEWRADDFMGEPEIVAWAKQ